MLSLSYTRRPFVNEANKMKRNSLTLVLTVSVASFVSTSVHAQSEVYLCIDANGKKEYRNTGSTKGCKLVDLPQNKPVAAPQNVKKAPPKVASTPAGFPKVDDQAQKTRDSDRKQILNDELKAEEQKLEALKKEYNGGEVERRADEKIAAKYVERVNNLKNDISRAEKNIEALKREIANLK